jgi:hypothetical protein
MKLPAWLKPMLPILALIAITAALSTLVYAQRIMNPTTDDYDAHIIFTLRLLKHDLPPTFVLAHPLLELIIGFLYWAGRGHIGLFETAVLVQVLAQTAAALILYFIIGKIAAKWGEILRVFLAVSLTLVAPIMLLAFIDGKFYFGYIGMASYHNPTVHLLRPFALLSFYFSLRAFRVPKNPAWMVLLASAVMFAGMLAKPNYGIALIPAVGVMTLWFLWKKRPLDWWMIILGQVVPFILCLAAQAVLIYISKDADAAGVIIAPFVVESYWSSYLPVKFLLSILFPLVVLLYNWRSIQKSDEMIMAWLAFFFSVVQLYLLAEDGGRIVDGNFRWGAQVTLLILFATSLRSVIQYELAIQLPWRARLSTRWPVYAAYLLHVGAGIAYYIYAFVQEGYA